MLALSSWNIERGLQFQGILDVLSGIDADLILLQEVDLNARRTRYRDVAQRLAHALHMNVAFGRGFRELSQGSGAVPAYHGLATLSPWPLSNARIIRFRHQSGFWKPRWYVPRLDVFQQRLGGRIALVTEARIYGHSVLTYNLHLESKGSDTLRLRQLQEVLEECWQYRGALPVVVAGDFNLDASRPDAAEAIRKAGIRAGVGLNGRTPTTARAWFGRSRPIDWILVSDSLPSAGEVHRDIRASDHYPVSTTLFFKRRLEPD